MLKHFSNFLFIAIFVCFSLIGILNNPVHATGCDWLGPFKGFCDNGTAINSEVRGDVGGTVQNAIQAGITIFFFAVLIIAVFYTLKAAITYVRAEGDEKKVGQAKASMRSILFGVGTMFIAVIAILFIYSFFGATTDASGDTGLGGNIKKLLEPIIRLFGGTTTTTGTNTGGSGS